MAERPPLRDYSRSRAVVMGTWEYEFLNRVPAAEHSLRRMQGLLTGPLCGWPQDRLLLVENEPGPGNLSARLLTAFDDVRDVALFYFVGNGQVSPDNDLCLGLVRSRQEANRQAATSLRLSDVRQVLRNSPASFKIVILDCPYAGPGTASEMLGTPTGPRDFAMVAFPASASARSWYQADPGLAQPQTYFTKYLADLVEQGIPGQPPKVSLGALFNRLAENLARDDLITPQSWASDVAAEFAFAYNAALPEAQRDPERDQGGTVVQVGRGDAQINYTYKGLTWTDGVAPPPLASVSGQVDSPYRGLAAFGERDAAFFFGREDAAARVLEQLSRVAPQGPGLLMVSGASGAGKSSLLRAGVLPRLRGAGLSGAPGAASWPCLVFTPGPVPLDELAVRVAPLAGADAKAVRHELRSNPAGFALTARQAALAQAGTQGDPAVQGASQRLLLVVDQFEQVFTQCADADERQAFITALCAAAGSGQSPEGVPAALVLLGVRADFEARCADYPELAGAVRNRYLLTSMTERQLRLAITGPVQAAGSRVDDELVEVLLRTSRPDATGMAALPLLSHVLDQAWRSRAGDALTLADYERVGGIEGAVAASAQRAYDGLTRGQQAAARQVFIGLTSVTEDGQDVSAPVSLAELTEGRSPAEAADVHAVLEAFAAERLLTLGPDSVEMSHRTLLTAWPLLRDSWLAEAHADRVIRVRLRNEAAEWDRSARDSSYLLRGSRLESALEAAGRLDAAPGRFPPLTQNERDFLAASQRSSRGRFRQALSTAAGSAGGAFAAMTGQRRPRDGAGERGAGDPPEGTPPGQQVAVEASSGVQVGDHNTQNNTFYYGLGAWSAQLPRPRGDGKPYRGLSTLEEADREFFFGRDTAVAEVMGRLSAASRGIVVVSGASGIGKSSLLRAGILPRLRRDGLSGNPGAKAWPWLRLTPGSGPLGELAAQVAALNGGISAEDARQQLIADPQRFGVLARQAVLQQSRQLPDQATAIPGERQRLLLAVDQFEEVFTQCQSEGERRAFITALESAATSPDPPVLVVVGVREDYAADCAEYPQLAAPVRDRYRLGPMTEQELELAITEPAVRAGASLERELTSRLLAEARGCVGALPLLSGALAGAWSARTRNVLTLADYDQVGGISAQALLLAERAYEALTVSQRDIARQVFLLLTATSSDGSGIALPAALDELYAAGGRRQVQPVLDAFAARRVITLTGDTAEISHPALTAAWPLLRDTWLPSRRQEAGAPARVLVDIEQRPGGRVIVVTHSDGSRVTRPVTIADLTDLTGAVDRGQATAEELSQYGAMLFESAFGGGLWQQVTDAAADRPCVELAIQAGDTADHTALQALRWEALHRDGRALALPGDGQDDCPPVVIIRTVPAAGQPGAASLRSAPRPTRRLPRVLFVQGSGAGAGQDDAETASIWSWAVQSGGLGDPRILRAPETATLARGVADFKPDILYLVGEGRQSPDGAVRLRLYGDRAAQPGGEGGEWASAESLLSLFEDAGHTPQLVILQAFQAAPAEAPSAPGSLAGPAEPGPLAAGLVAGGVPVVIAMASAIVGTASHLFTSELMSSVTLGVPLGTAIADARLATLRGPAPGSPRWALPTAFLVEHARTDVPLVDPEVLRTVHDRASALNLTRDPVSTLTAEAVKAVNQLLNGSDPLNVLMAAAPGEDDGKRLLRELGACAMRCGALPVVVRPVSRGGAVTLEDFEFGLDEAIKNVRRCLGVNPPAEPEVGGGVEYPIGLVGSVHENLSRLADDLPAADPLWSRAGGQPKVVLLSHVAGWQEEALNGLAEMLGQLGLAADPGGVPIPVVLTEEGAGALGAAVLGRWPGQDWLRALTLSRDEEAGLAEEADNVRALAAAGNYQLAEERLAALAAADSERAQRLRLELGFIGLPGQDRRVIASAWKATAAGHTVRSLLAADKAPPSADLLDTPDADAVPAQAPARPQPVVPASVSPSGSPRQSGAALEQAAADLFTRFFTVDPDVLASRLRQQGARAGFANDVELECSVKGSPTVRCHVEFKNLDRRVTLDDIAGKLAQQKLRPRDAQVDHWILISPHHDVTSDLRGILDTWERQGEYPCSVQVWSPESGVREVFALEPAVYQAVYGQPPAAEETLASAAAASLVRERLAPRLRVDPVWRRYVQEEASLCFVNENSPHFSALYALHLPLKAADQRGALLDGTLIDQVSRWAHDDHRPAPMLLLADFGEGKSVFTYCLARRLCEQFRAAPGSGLLPLRIPLREFWEAGSARGLLERRLSEVGATLADWRRLTSQVRTLAILDGFDEMSADLSPDAITANLKGIGACLTELSGSKVLITSRQRVLDGSRDWMRTLGRMRQPLVMRIAPGARRQRVQYLEKFATDEPSARVLANLRSLYDPIGLAAKPLFLEMIKETLRDLPDDTFSETILYDTYIGKSLRTKAELLADPDALLIDDELVENLKSILEEVAVRLQEDNASYIYLRDYRGKDGERIAELLWRMRDQAAPRGSFALAAQDDAANRVGIRSLLKAVPAPRSDQWPVDFFHRSMREYFTARAIVHSLTADDPEQARRVLSRTPLLPEITHFASTILRERPGAAALATLDVLARSAAPAGGGDYLGGNALTLLNAAGGLRPGQDWSGLCLDHARLRGADLRGARFAGSSLRYANLDNANLEDADLTGADLEGVRLEETSQVLAVTALGSNRIVAAYEDRSLREWTGQPGAGWESRVIATLGHKAGRLELTPQGRVMASGEGALSVLDVPDAGGADDPRRPAEEAAVTRCEFQTSSRCLAAVMGARSALFVEEADGGRIRVTWLDMRTARALDELEVHTTVTACAQLDGAQYALAVSDAIHVIWLDLEGQRKSAGVADTAVTCLSMRADEHGTLLAAGHHDGLVTLTRISPADDGTVVRPQWQRHLHDGPVTGILLDDEEQLVTGSTDRSVCIIPVSAMLGEEAEPSVQRLHLTPRCRNVRFEGVRTKDEQDKLRRYAAL